jgi:hypothetical protein
VDDFATVKFHVDGAGTLDRNKLEIIRSKASLYLGVPAHSVVVVGITLTNSYLVTFFIPVGFEKVLLSLDPTKQKSFLSIGVDFIIVNDKTIHLKGNILFNRCNYHFHLKLTKEKCVY